MGNSIRETFALFVGSILTVAWIVARNLSSALDISQTLRRISTCTPERIGGNPKHNWYGSWWLCEEEVGNGQTLVSFGSGCDSTFEWDFLSRSPTSDCHIMDPTITPDRFYSCSNNSQSALLGYKTSFHPTTEPHFWPIGLSDSSKLARFSRSKNPTIGSLTEIELKGYNQSSVYGILLDLHTAYTLLKIKEQPILKMDIEGSEFNVISSWCRYGMPSLKPTQLLIEFHQRLVPDGKKKLDSAISCLETLGYQKVFDNKEEEFLFILRS